MNAQDLLDEAVSATSKLVKAWESKINQRAMKAGGGLTMALTLAACGGSDDTTAVTTPTTPAAPITPATPVVTPVALTMATARDVLTANDFTTAADTVSATATTLTAVDVIAEGTAGDADVLTVTVADGVNVAAPASITGIESVNYDVSAFTVPSIDVDNIIAAEITVSNLQAGGATGANVDNLNGTSNVTFGAGVTGTADVALAAGSDSVITAGSAAQLDVAGIEDDGASIVATDATNTIEVEGTTATTDAISISGAGAVALDTNDAAGGTTDQVENLTLSGNGAAVTFTLNAGDAPETVAFEGDQNVTLVAAAADLTTETVTNTSTGVATIQINDDATANLDLVATSVVINVADQTTGSTTLTVANDANVTLSANGVITFDSDELTTGDETINLTLEVDGAGDAITVSDFEVVNLSTATPTTLTGDLDAEVVAGATSVINLTGAVDLALDTATVADSLNAAAYTGDITMTVTAANLNELTLGAGDDTITVATTETATIVGGAGTDTLVTAADMDGFTFSGFEVLDATVAVTALDASQLTDAMTIIGGDVTVDNADIATVDFSMHTVASAVNFTFDGTLDTTVFASTQGLTITGNVNADTLTGTANADTISGGAGNDLITGNAGADTLTGGAGDDDFIFTAAGGIDTITDFVSGEDDLDVTTGIIDAVVAETVVTSARAQDTMVDGDVFYISTDGTAASVTTSGTATLDLADLTATTLTDLATFLSEAYATSGTATDDALFVINWTANDTSYVYDFAEAATNTVVAASELTLVAIVDNGGDVLTTGDVI